MIEQFANWLDQTQPSIFIKNILWLIPFLQSIHIVAVSIILSSVGMIGLRVCGLAGTRASLVETARRYVPWIFGALVVLLATGTILVIGEPVRNLANPSFQLKMLMLLIGVIMVCLFQRSVRGASRLWGDSPGDATSYWTGKPHQVVATLKIAAICTFLLFCAVAIAGRWIAYTQPPS